MSSCSATEHPVSEDQTTHVRLLCHNASFLFSSTPQLLSLPMERFFTRRAGPPTTAWPRRHAEEEFLGLVRHNTNQAGVGVVATSLEEDTRWEAKFGRPVNTGPGSRHLQRPCRRRSVQAGGATACRSSLKGVHRQMAPRPSLEPAKPKRAYHQPSRDLRKWVVAGALPRHLHGWDNKTIADHLAAWLPHVFQLWLSMRTLRRWLDENKKEGREPRDAVDAIIPILREKCDRVGEAGVPVSACVMQPLFNRVAEQHVMTRRFGIHWIRHFLCCACFKAGTKKTTDPKLLDTHVDKLMHHVTEYGVHPSCIMNMDETAAKLLGWGTAAGRDRSRTDGCALSTPLTSEISRSRRSRP